MFARIVVPSDLTDRNLKAVEAAAKMIEREGGTIYLLHVIETIPGFALDEERDFYDKLEKSAVAHLEKIGAKLGQRGIDWRLEIAYGPRARTVLDEASRLDASLIVIQSHRLEATQAQEGWGTLSFQIGILSDRPVLLVK